MNSTEKYLVKMIDAVLPKAVAEINSVISRPYWGTINVGEAFERIFSGFANDKGFPNDCEGKKGSVVDLYVHRNGSLVQIKTTHPLTKNHKYSFNFCRTSASHVDEAVQEVRTKFFRAFNQYASKSFYMIHHDFKNKKTELYLLATKDTRVKFAGKFLNGDHGCMGKDYLVIPKSDFKLVWEKSWVKA